MKKRRRKLNKDFKAKVALEAIKGQRPLNELAQEFGVQPNQIGIWKKQLLESAPEIFNRGKDRAAEAAEVERATLGVTHLKGTCQGAKKFYSRVLSLLFIPDIKSLVAPLISIYQVSASAASVTHQDQGHLISPCHIL